MRPSLQILVTRPSHQADELANPLREAGFLVTVLPMIETAAPADLEPLRAAAQNADRYDWIIFTSANAVRALGAQRGTARPTASIAVVGTATRKAVEALGWTVDVVPARFVAEGLVGALQPLIRPGQKVLFPSAAVTRGLISQSLTDLGADVDIVEAYRTVCPEAAKAEAQKLFDAGNPFGWITFTSSSAVDNLAASVGADALRGSRIASLGEITSASIRSYGLAVSVEPEEHTIDALVDAIRRDSATNYSTMPPPQK